MKISEINIGTEITVKKIMTEELINLFSEISDDKNPIHLDNEYAKELLKEKAQENQINSNNGAPKQEIKKNNFTQQKNDLGYDKKDIEKMQRLIEIINQ